MRQDSPCAVSCCIAWQHARENDDNRDDDDHEAEL